MKSAAGHKTGRRLFNTARDWLTKVPSGTPNELERYVVYWRIFYTIAGFAHLLAMANFVRAGVTFMAYFNVYSVAAFLLAYHLTMRGRFRLAYWIALTELAIHGMAAIICVGNQAGFENYVFLVVILAFIQPFYSWQTSALIAIAALLSAASAMAYALNFSPIYVYPEELQSSALVISLVTWPLYVLAMVLPFVRASAQAEEKLAEAYSESERLLLNILPATIADRLKASSDMIADEYDRAAVLFVDIAGFTTMSAKFAPAQIVSILNTVFNSIDEVIAKYPAEKIKTIGDAYMVAVGIPDPVDDPDEIIAALALDVRDAISVIDGPDNMSNLQARIGINCGRVVAGVIGQKKFAYDLWGDTVNLASRMESTGEIGKIQVPAEFATRLENRFIFEPRGTVLVKGKGEIETCFLISRK